MDGFSVAAQTTRAGRTVASSSATIVDGAGAVRATAVGLHVAGAERPVVDHPVESDDPEGAGGRPRLADTVEGPFPFTDSPRALAWFGDGVAMRYPAGEPPGSRHTTVWMRSVPLVPGEEPTPFQRICPLADCGNAFSRHAEPDRITFVNPDLTIALHRPPQGDWLGMRASSHWQPTGVGLVTARLFDDGGSVGTALQTGERPRSAAVSMGS
jgi:hypothetical protein